MQVELKPCPDCGGEPKWDCMERDADGVCLDWSPECGCGATIIGKDRLTKAEAIAAWNRRADRAEVVREIVALLQGDFEDWSPAARKFADVIETHFGRGE